MEISESVISSVITAAVTFGATYATLRATLKNQGDRIKELEESKAEEANRRVLLTDKLHSIEVDLVKLNGRVERVEELKTTTVTYDAFNGRMNTQDETLRGQDRVLKEIKQTLERKVSIPAVAAAAPRPDTRAEPESEPPVRPPVLPPMRGKMGSRSG